MEEFRRDSDTLKEDKKDTREDMLEAVYKEVEETMPDDGVAKPDVLNGLQETMIMLSYQAKISEKMKEWYRG